MRRILAGVVAFVAGLTVYIYTGSLAQSAAALPPKAALLAGFAIAVGTYALIDWLGLLPPPFEHTARTLMHDDPSESSDNGRRS